MGEYHYNDIKLFETGCLCYEADYKFTQPTSKQWAIGCARIVLNDGKIDKNLSHCLYYNDNI
jgi:hypothetical protein